MTLACVARLLFLLIQHVNAAISYGRTLTWQPVSVSQVAHLLQEQNKAGWAVKKHAGKNTG